MAAIVLPRAPRARAGAADRGTGWVERGDGPPGEGAEHPPQVAWVQAS